MFGFRNLIVRARAARMTSHVVNIGEIAFSVVHDHHFEWWERISRLAWEPDTLGAMASVIGPEWIFLDIGAWIGPTALYAAALGADTYAFEPDPIAYERFVANLAINPTLRHRVKVINAACFGSRWRSDHV